MKIACYTPLPPGRSGIAAYSAELLPCLARYAEIDVFADGEDPGEIAPIAGCQVYPGRQFESLRAAQRYDLCLYQLGNSVAHAGAYRALPRFPGVVVLHDFTLHHLVVALTAGRGDEDAYVREMGYAHGRAGIDAARWAVAHDHRFPYLDFPLNRRVLDASLGLIVHSEHVRGLVERMAPGRPVAVVRQHTMIPPPAWSRSRTRAELGVGDDDVLFGSFGFITPPKRLDVALRAFHQARVRLPGARYVVVGEASTPYDLRPLVSALGLNDAIIWTGYVDQPRLLALLDAIDVGVNLRWPIVGETSASLLRILAAGRPAITTDAGPFAEFPDACCWKVPVGDEEEGRVAAAMLALGQNLTRRRSMGEAARRYVREFHRPEDAARAYAAFLEQLLQTPGVKRFRQ